MCMPKLKKKKKKKKKKSSSSRQNFLLQPSSVLWTFFHPHFYKTTQNNRWVYLFCLKFSASSEVEGVPVSSSLVFLLGDLLLWLCLVQ